MSRSLTSAAPEGIVDGFYVQEGVDRHQEGVSWTGESSITLLERHVSATSEQLQVAEQKAQESEKRQINCPSPANHPGLS